MPPVIDEAIKKTISAVETIAPKAWELMVHAERVTAIVDVAESIVWLIALCIAARFAYSFAKNGKGGIAGIMNDDEPFRFLALVGCACALVGALVNTLHIPQEAARVAMPEIFAAKALITKATGS